MNKRPTALRIIIFRNASSSYKSRLTCPAVMQLSIDEHTAKMLRCCASLTMSANRWNHGMAKFTGIVGQSGGRNDGSILTAL